MEAWLVCKIRMVILYTGGESCSTAPAATAATAATAKNVDAQAAETATAQAITVLKEFYSKAGDATAFVQQDP